jgi:hypothetical protein
MRQQMNIIIHINALLKVQYNTITSIYKYITVILGCYLQERKTNRFAFKVDQKDATYL